MASRCDNAHYTKLHHRLNFSLFHADSMPNNADDEGSSILDADTLAAFRKNSSIVDNFLKTQGILTSSDSKKPVNQFDYLYLSRMTKFAWHIVTGVSLPIESKNNKSDIKISCKSLGGNTQEFRFRVDSKTSFLPTLTSYWESLNKKDAKPSFLLWKNQDKRTSKSDATRSLWQMDFVVIEKKQFAALEKKLTGK